MTQHLIFYGKGGVGKSTLTSNLSAALAADGYRVLQVGCDLKDDSCSILRGGERISTVLELLREGRKPTLDEVVVTGFNGVHCIEVGDPGGSCAASGVGDAFRIIRDLEVIETLRPDVVLYDAPGETVCAHAPLSLDQGGNTRWFVVTSSDFMSVYATNGILRKRNDGRRAFGGLIANSLTGPLAEAVVTDYTKRTSAPLLSLLPRSLMVMQCELYGKTVLEAEPASGQAYLYRKLAGNLIKAQVAESVQPLDVTALKEWARGWGDRIYELESGVLNSGEGI